MIVARPLAIGQFNDIVMFCEQSLLQNQLDDLSNQVDLIYSSHLSASDKKTLEQSYAQLDALFQNGQPEQAQDKQAAQLFAKIDVLFDESDGDTIDEAPDELCTSDKNRVQSLESQIDSIFDATAPHTRVLPGYYSA